MAPLWHCLNIQASSHANKWQIKHMTHVSGNRYNDESEIAEAIFGERMEVEVERGACERHPRSLTGLVSTQHARSPHSHGQNIAASYSPRSLQPFGRPLLHCHMLYMWTADRIFCD